jgi:CTP:molybdopterin cytidylyltransferase MocA
LLYEKDRQNPHKLTLEFQDKEICTYCGKTPVFSDVSTIIFGHTHVPADRRVIQVSRDRPAKAIYNDGAFVDVHAASFVGINAAGNVKLYMIP